MFAVRLIVLLFLVAYGWGMGQTPPDGLNAFGKFISFSFFFTAPALYLLPTFEASKNNHPKLQAIALLNIFLGWSVLGWVGALVWAFAGDKQKPATPTKLVIDENTGKCVEVPNIPETPGTKKCPYCAEEIKAEAIKCKHCQSDLTAA